MEARRCTVLTNVGWECARESLRCSLRVTEFQLAKLDGSAFAFKYTDSEGNQKSYVLYKTWVPEKLPYKTCTHILFSAFQVLNQIPNERDCVPYLLYKEFSTGKVVTWPEGALLLH